MQVLGLGFSRTGTSCMFPVLVASSSEIWETNHGFTIWTSPPEREMWTEAINVKFFGMGKPYGRAEWDQLPAHCVAVTYIPHLLFAEELMAAYPEAKIVLTTRNVDSWWKSYKDTIGRALTNPPGILASRFFRHVSNQTRNGGNRQGAIHRVYEEVWRLVQKEQLLEYRIGEGWESLCEFLDKGIPAEPFPKVNDTQAFHTHMQQRVLPIWCRAVLRYIFQVLFPLL
ncbi:P-loop containing nucleoside triphosphate hydrolase protein [Mycena leptocephala]|nr:P-loop containing nucleoside triphosphate hydrolase protein [Mycena leptocephala]